jgi:hypothetical protein
MNPVRLLACLAAAGSAALPLVAAGLSARPPRAPAEGPDIAGRPLSAVEASIAAHPFAPPAIQKRMRLALETKEMAPPVPGPKRGDMGWAYSDAECWRRMPAAARAIPRSWSRLPTVRFTNTEIGGVRQVWLSAGPAYDLWLLRDAPHDLWACIAVHRASRRVYFQEIRPTRHGGWQPRLAKDNCYSCHPSGPRVIRPFDERRVDRAALERLNRRILSYGACDFGGTVDSAMQGAPYWDLQCAGCHDGVTRGRLYQANRRAVAFKTQAERAMPPGRAGG